MVIFTTLDSDKNYDTSITVVVQNTQSQIIASLQDYAGDMYFGSSSSYYKDLTLASDNTAASDLATAMVRITISPKYRGRWKFDVTFIIIMSDGSKSSTTKNGIVFNQSENRTYSGSLASG